MTPYLELMKKALTGLLYNEDLWLPEPWEEDHETYGIRNGHMMLLKHRDFSPGSKAEWRRRNGKDWPLFAQTMIGMQRLEHLQWCVDRVLTERIPGDFIECGVWRGGASIFMKAVLTAWKDNERNVWLADSFDGLPPYDGRYPRDEAAPDHTFERMKVPAVEVIRNFQRYGLADNRVHLLEGWFHETLPLLDCDWAILRLDGDLYGSTMDALVNLYERLVPGGFCIIDDYALDRCKDAVNDFRKEQNITADIQRIDWTGVYWRKDK